MVVSVIVDMRAKKIPKQNLNDIINMIEEYSIFPNPVKFVHIIFPFMFIQQVLQALHSVDKQISDREMNVFANAVDQ